MEGINTVYPLSFCNVFILHSDLKKGFFNIYSRCKYTSLCFSQQQVLSCFPVSFPCGEYQVLWRLRATRDPVVVKGGNLSGESCVLLDKRSSLVSISFIKHTLLTQLLQRNFMIKICAIFCSVPLTQRANQSLIVSTL